jgi:hypothetical protein
MILAMSVVSVTITSRLFIKKKQRGQVSWARGDSNLFFSRFSLSLFFLFSFSFFFFCLHARDGHERDGAFGVCVQLVAADEADGIHLRFHSRGGKISVAHKLARVQAHDGRFERHDRGRERRERLPEKKEKKRKKKGRVSRCKRKNVKDSCSREDNSRVQREREQGAAELFAEHPSSKKKKDREEEEERTKAMQQKLQLLTARQTAGCSALVRKRG